MSESLEDTLRRKEATIENLLKDLRAMRIGREEDDLNWRKLWEKEKRRAEEARAATIAECVAYLRHRGNRFDDDAADTLAALSESDGGPK